MKEKLEILKGLLDRLNKTTSVLDQLNTAGFDEETLTIIADSLIEAFKKEVIKLDNKKSAK